MLSIRGLPEELVSTRQKCKSSASKQRPGKAGFFCPVLWQNCVCPPSELILLYQHASHILFSGERHMPLTHLSVDSEFWKPRHPDSMAKDFCLVILHRASMFSVVLAFPAEVSVEWYRKVMCYFLLLLPPSKALNKRQNICILNKMPILTFFPVGHNHLYSIQVLSLHQDQPGLLYM